MWPGKQLLPDIGSRYGKETATMYANHRCVSSQKMFALIVWCLHCRSRAPQDRIVSYKGLQALLAPLCKLGDLSLKINRVGDNRKLRTTVGKDGQLQQSLLWLDGPMKDSIQLAWGAATNDTKSPVTTRFGTIKVWDFVSFALDPRTPKTVRTELEPLALDLLTQLSSALDAAVQDGRLGRNTTDASIDNNAHRTKADERQHRQDSRAKLALFMWHSPDAKFCIYSYFWLVGLKHMTKTSHPNRKTWKGFRKTLVKEAARMTIRQAASHLKMAVEMTIFVIMAVASAIVEQMLDTSCVHH